MKVYRVPIVAKESSAPYGEDSRRCLRASTAYSSATPPLDRPDGAARITNMDIPSTVSLLNQDATTTACTFPGAEPSDVLPDDKTLPNPPSSVVNVMQTSGIAAGP